MNEMIPDIDLQDILQGHPLIVPTELEYVNGSIPDRDAIALMSILAKEHPAEVLEIGTYMGSTTRRMSDTLPGSIIHTVDLPPDTTSENDPNWSIKSDREMIQIRDVGRNFKDTKNSKIKQHIGDTLNWDFKESGNPTFFFIDGSHTYEYCKNDSDKCFELCGGKGVFLWHDCDPTYPGIIKTLNEWRDLGRDVKHISNSWLGYWKSI